MSAVRMMSEGLRPVSAALLCPSWLASGADRGVDAAVQDHPADSAHACAFRQGQPRHRFGRVGANLGAVLAEFS